MSSTLSLGRRSLRPEGTGPALLAGPAPRVLAACRMSGQHNGHYQSNA